MEVSEGGTHFTQCASAKNDVTKNSLDGQRSALQQQFLHVSFWVHSYTIACAAETKEKQMAEEKAQAL